MSTIVDDIRSRQNSKRSPQQALFETVDQSRVRADLAAFFGPRAEVYLETYEKMRAAEPKRRLAVRTWSWPVFFGGFTWFFYRKMHIYGALAILTPIVMSYLLGSTGSGGMTVIFAFSAKGWYVNHALGRIAKADDLGLYGAERTEYLGRAGGVSLAAGIFAGIIYGLAFALMVVGIVARHKMRHP